MKILREVSENEMVLAFLKAELHSERWKDKVEKILFKYKLENKIIDEPNLHDMSSPHFVAHTF